MFNLTLQPIPNQTLTTLLDGSVYDMTFKECNGAITCDITRDNVSILKGQRVVAGNPIIPYKYLEKGNFVLTTLNEELPDYTQFGASQMLVYITVADLAVIRAGP